MTPRLVLHRHRPLYRVVRAGWADPLDPGFSQRRPDRRWNTAAFPALYCCCSPRVARAVARDLFRFAGVELEELAPAFRPRLVELAWWGRVVDVASARGVAAAGLPTSYPRGVEKEATRERAVEWHRAGAQGVVCRSASLARLGLAVWRGGHEPWSELAIYVENSDNRPRLLGDRADLDGLEPR